MLFTAASEVITSLPFVGAKVLFSAAGEVITSFFFCARLSSPRQTRNNPLSFAGSKMLSYSGMRGNYLVVCWCKKLVTAAGEVITSLFVFGAKVASTRQAR